MSVGAPTFTGATLDRAAEIRADPDRVASLARQPTSSVLAATKDAVLIDEATGTALRRRPLQGDTLRYIDPEHPVLLGIDAGGALFAADLERLDPTERRPFMDRARLMPLRDAGAVLPRSEGGLAAYMVAVLNWHRRHQFCANCGAQTEIVEAGLARRCPECGASHFPRTDPVVIMVVEYDGQLLLGRRRGWPAGQYSLLAGFVSPGETPEEAVVREVREESGIETRGPRYVASQPWPFPASLMLGFEAQSDGGTPAPGDGELEDVGWFSLANVRAARQNAEGFRLPPGVSIASTLIEGWVARRTHER